MPLISQEQIELLKKKQLANAFEKIKAGKSVTRAEQELIDSFSKDKKSSLPRTVRAVKGICAIIRAEFDMSCDRMKIKNWQTRHSPPFPSADENNAFNVEECLEWVRQLQKRKGVPAGDSAQVELDRKADEARAQKKILEVEREQFSFDLEKGKYVEREIANRTIAGAAKAYHAVVRKFVHAAVPADTAIQIVKAIEDECERIASGDSQRV